MASVRAAAKTKERPAEPAAKEPARPAGAEDIARMLAEAEAIAERRKREKVRARAEKAADKRASGQSEGASAIAAPPAHSRLWQVGSFLLVWAGLAAALAAGLYIALSPDALKGPGLVFILGLAALTGALIAGGALKLFSPTLVGGALLRRAAGDEGEGGGQLAGADMLAALGIAGKVLDADPDARLVARRDGVVVYANAGYVELARDTGIMGPAGLPPRIDRLFAAGGAEATKLFRLCRAAKSAAPAEEVLRYIAGAAARRRRFEVSVRSVAGAEDHVAWRIRELPLEEEERDALAASYADYLRPVFALEKSGHIAWANAATRERLGAERGALNHIDDIVLGETGDLVRALWQVDQAPQKAKVRRRGADPADAEFTAFRRGGVGEGFVCVDLSVEEEEEAEDTSPTVSGDVSEAPFGVAIIEGEIGHDARIVEANKAFTEVFGGARKNAPLARLLPAETLTELADEIRRKAASGGAPRPVDTLAGEGAAARAFALYARPVRRRRGSYGARRTLLYSVDVTDRRRIEKESAQDQKLRAIGRLASEVAHDFNNVLQVVLGKCEYLMLRHPAGDPSYMDLVLINQTAQRAANMVKQLLAYSREQTLRREVSSITEILRDFARFLDGAVGEKVKLELINGRGLPLIKVDRNQLETAIMNLAVNARDAMGASGGKVTIRTSHIAADEVENLKIAGRAAQDHLLIEVSDTGPGVPQEIRDRIFDPFFTTKGPGKGTGLGLSTVFGIIGQMEGTIVVGDAPDGGALFRIYLPAYHGDASDELQPEVIEANPADLTGAGRILVVEDEDAVRGFVVTALEDRGYEVTTAEDGDEALELIGEDETGFDLIITDVMMPEVDGPTLIARARAEHGLKAKVIFMSGYAENAVRADLDQVEDAAYIQKPFTLKGLAAKVKSTLTGKAA